MTARALHVRTVEQPRRIEKSWPASPTGNVRDRTTPQGPVPEEGRAQAAAVETDRCVRGDGWPVCAPPDPPARTVTATGAVASADTPGEAPGTPAVRVPGPGPRVATEVTTPVAIVIVRPPAPTVVVSAGSGLIVVVSARTAQARIGLVAGIAVSVPTGIVVASVAVATTALRNTAAVASAPIVAGTTPAVRVGVGSATTIDVRATAATGIVVAVSTAATVIGGTSAPAAVGPPQATDPATGVPSLRAAIDQTVGRRVNSAPKGTVAAGRGRPGVPGTPETTAVTADSVGAAVLEMAVASMIARTG